MELKTKYGKVTFRIFNGDKAAQISIDSVIVRYYASYCIFDRQKIFKNNREIIEHLTSKIQNIVDNYQLFDQPEFSLASFVKYHLLDEMFQSPCVCNLRAHVNSIII